MINTILNKSLNISSEEKFIIYILFKDERTINKKINFKKINYELLVKIASKHLILPALYVNLLNKGFLKSIPNELKLYLKKIYNLNKQRNEILKEEVNFLSNVLNNKNINHVFIKGSSYILNNLYDNIGERMVGDIDFLVSKEDYDKTIKLVKTLDYTETSKYVFFNELHYPRLKNKNKLFSVEIHKYLISKKNKKLIDIDLVLKKRVLNNNKIFIMNPKEELLYNIYSFQINDFGSYYEYYNYKNLYDSIKIINKNQINLKTIITKKYVKKYFIFMKLLEITNEKIKLDFIDKFFISKYYLKNKYNVLNVLSTLLLKLINKIEIIPNQIKELTYNPNYRKHLLIKLGLKKNDDIDK